MKTILFTGGGSAGHVVPNIALIEYLNQHGWQSHYIGSYAGIEKTLIAPLNIPYHGISTGKLRRFKSWRNLLTPFQVLTGIWQAWRLLRKIKPAVVFSKGGFVAFPVVFAAWLSRIPVIIHESDFTPGLANRLSIPFAQQICVNFPGAEKHFKNPEKVVVTGIPLRKTFTSGSRDRGLNFLQFTSSKPVLLIYGGSLGAQKLNNVTWQNLSDLTQQFQVVHVCGANKTDPQYDKVPDYRQFPYINEEFGDVINCADLVVSRAGANTVYELIALQKNHILIPLSKSASRGDQIENAEYAKEKGYSTVLQDEDLNTNSLKSTIKHCWSERDKIHQQLQKFSTPDSFGLILSIINNCAEDTKLIQGKTPSISKVIDK
jgi:UDP-N-acetylglucosamine--N-acetylmuramyl-(pentapeptide) pyrophosphoryl-undecaprenol N-acetylglucosamine transferase